MATCRTASHTWPRTKGLRTGTLKISAFTLRQHWFCHHQWFCAHKEQATFSLVSQPCWGVPPARSWGCRMSPAAGHTCQGWTDVPILQTDKKPHWSTEFLPSQWIEIMASSSCGLIHAQHLLCVTSSTILHAVHKTDPPERNFCLWYCDDLPNKWPSMKKDVFHIFL